MVDSLKSMRQVLIHDIKITLDVLYRTITWL